MRVIVSSSSDRSDSATQVTLRIALEHGQVLRLPAAVEDVLVLTGRAWATVDGADLILEPGQHFAAPHTSGAIVLSALGQRPTIVEMTASLDSAASLDSLARRAAALLNSLRDIAA